MRITIAPQKYTKTLIKKNFTTRKTPLASTLITGPSRAWSTKFERVPPIQQVYNFLQIYVLKFTTGG